MPIVLYIDSMRAIPVLVVAGSDDVTLFSVVGHGLTGTQVALATAGWGGDRYVAWDQGGQALGLLEDLPEGHQLGVLVGDGPVDAGMAPGAFSRTETSTSGDGRMPHSAAAAK